MKIMVVEDEWIVSDQICRDLEDFGYTVCKTASSGNETVEKIEEERPDLILMDIVLKGSMDGIETAGLISSRFDIPIIYLTAYTSLEYIERAKRTKPFGYLVKPFTNTELRTNIEMAIHRHKMDREVESYLNGLAKCYRGAINAISETVELRGPYKPGHHKRVAESSHVIAKEMDLTGSSIEGLLLAAWVYDVSLVNIPADIIQSSGQLTGTRLTIYQTYPQLSYDVLKEIDFPWPVAEIVLQHREHYDGSGFPRRIRGSDILTEARILAVADAIEDLTSHRSFRDALPLGRALDEIKSRRGSWYDPDVVDVCLRCFSKKGQA